MKKETENETEIERVPADTSLRATAWCLHGPMAPTDWPTLAEAIARREEPALSPADLTAIDVHGITAMRDLSMRQHAEYRAIEGIRNRRQLANEPTLNVQAQMRDRIAARVRVAVRLAYHQCGYRHSANKWAGGEHDVSITVVDYGAAVGVTGESQTAWSSNGKWRGTNSCHRISVPLTWIVSVEREGIAVVEGRLVLGAWSAGERIVHGECVWRVLYAEQGRGVGLVTRAGLVYRRDNGEWIHARTMRGARSMATQREREKSLTAERADDAEVTP